MTPLPTHLASLIDDLGDPDPLARTRTASVLLVVVRLHQRADALAALDHGHPLRAVAKAMHTNVDDLQDDLAAWAAIDPNTISQTLPYLTPELIDRYQLGDQP
ncbi:MAG: hypothetical protein AAF467_05680 [Actinomycetota bacterium]